MLIGSTTNRVYTSPSFHGELSNARDVQNALFHLSAHLFSLKEDAPNPFGKTLEDIYQYINRYIQGQESLTHQLRHRHLILPDNPIHVIAANLREIASHTAACSAIAHSSTLTRQLAEYVKDTPIDIGEVREAAREWNLSLPSIARDPLSHSLFGSITQALRLMTPQPGITTAVGFLKLLLSNNRSETAARLLEAGALSAFHEQEKVRNFLTRALDPINTRNFQDYFLGNPPRYPATHAMNSESEAFFEALRYSHGPGGNPTQSWKALATLVADFMHVGALASASVFDDPSRATYERLLGIGTLTMLEHQNWQPIFLNQELMTQVHQLRAKGAKLIAIGNHRSHLDPILFFGIHPSSFVAKNQLLSAFILGDNPFLHPQAPESWQKDSVLCAYPHLTIDREAGEEEYLRVENEGIRLMEDDKREGHSVFWLPEGTRAKTPSSKEEVGALRFRSGAFKFAAKLNERHPDNTYIVVYAICGTGQILPTDIPQVLKHGVRQNQPVVIAPCAILKVSDYLRNTPEETFKALEMAATVEQARFLRVIQAANNNGALVQAS